MTGGKKLTIALAIAIPVLILGGGLALAAGDAPDLKIGDKAAPSSAVAPVSTVTAISAPYDYCDGDCTSIGDCSGLCDGDCDGPCAEAGLVCPNTNAQCAGGGAGNCGGTTAQTRSGCGGSACGQLAADVEVVGPACSSCDVAGLNEYPVNSPKYKATT